MTTMKISQIFALLTIAMTLVACAAPKRQNCTNVCSSMLQPEEAAPAATQLDISGNWGWVCCNQKYSGKLELTQAAGGGLSGKIFEANGDEAGQIVGSNKAGDIHFTRTWGDGLEQTYTLTLSADGKSPTGTLDGTRDETVGADFEAKKP